MRRLSSAAKTPSGRRTRAEALCKLRPQSRPPPAQEAAFRPPAPCQPPPSPHRGAKRLPGACPGSPSATERGQSPRSPPDPPSRHFAEGRGGGGRGENLGPPPHTYTNTHTQHRDAAPRLASPPGAVRAAPQPLPGASEPRRGRWRRGGGPRYLRARAVGGPDPCAAPRPWPPSCAGLKLTRRDVRAPPPRPRAAAGGARARFKARARRVLAPPAAGKGQP